MRENELVVYQTEDVTISAGSELVEKGVQQFVWGYYFCIENTSNERIHLLGKNWNITDEKGNRFCDDSEGFKGEIPELEPGECFEFSSLAPIASPNAVFYGSCKIKKDSQCQAENVRIPTFSLSSGQKFSSMIN